jgi:hypothetical protein
MGQKLLGLSALLIVAVASGQDRPEPPKRVVSVHLSFSLDQFEPAKPTKASVKCVVKNNSPWPVHVPVGYEGGYIQLRARGLNLVVNKREKDNVKLAWVEPGKEQLVFELPLNDIFRVASKDDYWHWTWQRRPAPPLSPIHKGQAKAEFVEQASFMVSIDLGGYRIESESVRLNVKADVTNSGTRPTAGSGSRGQ